MKKILAAGITLFALATSAGAADLPRGAPAYKGLPPVMAAPAWSWTGFYAGINGGWGFGNMYGDAGWAAAGGLIGGTVGYNWQTSNLVFGVEGDLDWANTTGSTNVAVLGLVPPPGSSCVIIPGGAGCPVTSNLSWLGTLRGRLGFAAFDRGLIYATGGLALSGNSITLDNLGSSNNVSIGYTVGAGMEYMVAPHWSIKGEYLWVDTSTKSYVFTAAAANEGWRGGLARAGLNYRFD